MRITVSTPIIILLTFTMVVIGGCAVKSTETTFMDEFKGNYLKGDFPKLLEMTSSVSKLQYGEDRILKCYEQMNFAYDMTYLSTIDNGDHKVLRYKSDLMGMTFVAKVTVVREDGQLKVVLRDLEETWGRCVQEGI